MSTYNIRFLVRRDTTAAWDAHPEFVPLSGEVIVYTDHRIIDNGDGTTTLIPGIKIGDGNAYCVDLPFIDSGDVEEILRQLDKHINDKDLHTTAEEKTAWNAKVKCEMNGETLAFSI